MKEAKITALVLITGLSGLSRAAAGANAAEPAPRKPVVAGVERFPLERVRLLDGPFRKAQELDHQDLLSLDPDRLLITFRANAGIPRGAGPGATYEAPLGGWESPASLLRGHTTGHYLSACALMYAATGDPELRRRMDYVVAELAKCQQELAKTGTTHPGYLSAFPEFIFDRLDAGQPGVWAPWYTIHKIMAGLLEVWVHTGNPQALDVLERLTAWVKFRVDRLTPEQMQTCLLIEHGGMNEVLANLSSLAGEPDYLRLAECFNDRSIFGPLARHEDVLDGMHANTQIPKIIGAAREYELTGRPEYREVARFFWREVALKRSYALGGVSDDEHFFPVADFAGHLSSKTAETCDTYNMLKLTEHIFDWEPSAATMDFYERGLYNDILASIEPERGMFTYFIPMKPGCFETYSTKDDTFWCCMGTGMENHAKYGQEIYSHGGGALYVNLFIPSELDWPERGLKIRQETRFPEEQETRLRIVAGGGRMPLKIRQPGWCEPGIGLTVNGQPAAGSPDGSGYVTLERDWRPGDVVDVSLPMRLRTEALPGDDNIVAFFFGPVLLAGALGTEGMPADGEFTRDERKFVNWPTPPVPTLTGTPAEILAALKPVAGQALTFRTQGVGRPVEVTMLPFYEIHHQRYAVYWPLATPRAGN